MTTLASLPSRYVIVKRVLLLTGRRQLRTTNNHPDLVVDTSHSIIDIIRSLQNLRGCHPNLLIRQLLQSLQRIFYLSPSN
jgi:hypothetical protein